MIGLTDEYHEKYVKLLTLNSKKDIFSLHNIPRLAREDLNYSSELKEELIKLKIIKREIDEFLKIKGPLDDFI